MGRASEVGLVARALIGFVPEISTFLLAR